MTCQIIRFSPEARTYNDAMNTQRSVIQGLRDAINIMRARKQMLMNEVVMIDGDIARAKQQCYEEMERLDMMVNGGSDD